MGFLNIFLSMLGWEVGSAILAPAMDYISGRGKLEDLQAAAQKIQARNQDIASRRVVTDEQAGLLARDATRTRMSQIDRAQLSLEDPANFEALSQPMPPTPPKAPGQYAPGVRTSAATNPKLDAAMVGGVVNPVLLDQLEASIG